MNSPRKSCPSHIRHGENGFSLVELLIVIAVIAIMASLVISAFSNAAGDSRNVLVKNQQVVLQEAINSWIAHASSSPHSLTDAKTTYATATTSKARLQLIQPYLDDSTYNHLLSNSTADGTQVRSDASIKTGQYFEITNWPDDSYPKVYLHAAP